MDGSFEIFAEFAEIAFVGFEDDVAALHVGWGSRSLREVQIFLRSSILTRLCGPRLMPRNMQMTTFMLAMIQANLRFASAYGSRSRFVGAEGRGCAVATDIAVSGTSRPTVSILTLLSRTLPEPFSSRPKEIPVASTDTSSTT